MPRSSYWWNFLLIPDLFYFLLSYGPLLCPPTNYLYLNIWKEFIISCTGRSMIEIRYPYCQCSDSFCHSLRWLNNKPPKPPGENNSQPFSLTSLCCWKRVFAMTSLFCWQTPSSNNLWEDATHGHHQMVNTEIRLIIFFAAKNGDTLYSDKNKTRSWLWLRSWTPYCQIRLKLNKVGKTTGPFRYDLNQIPYNYTVEVRNRSKGLDLIDRVPEKLWMEVRDIV